MMHEHSPVGMILRGDRGYDICVVFSRRPLTLNISLGPVQLVDFALIGALLSVTLCETGMANRLRSPRAANAGNAGGCIRCCTSRFDDCDFQRPRCARCTAENLTCSYEWKLSSIIGLFPPRYNLNKEITLRSAETIADRGGFGKVYRTSLKNGRHQDVAVKVLIQRKQTSERMLLLALREALTWSKLEHEHIVPLVGLADYSKICEHVEPQLCLVSPWMGSGNVMDYLAVKPEANRKIIMLDVADGLSYLHACSPVVIHGDIRGSNILINICEGQPRACLTDFGLSFILEEQSRSGNFHSTSTASAGHPRWLAPERLFPEDFNLSPYTSKSSASDVFEMCRTFLEIISGDCPFAGVNDWRVPQMVLDGIHPERPTVVYEDLSDEVWTMLEHSWSQDPGQRPSATDVHAILALEVITSLGDSNLVSSFLAKLSIPEKMRLVEHDSHGHVFTLAGLLDTVKLQFRLKRHSSFDDVEEDVISSIPVLSRIMASSESLQVLRKALNIVGDIDMALEKGAPTSWRSQHTKLYLDLVDAEVRLLAFLPKLDSELQTWVRCHLNALVLSREVGEACRERIIQAGGIPTVVADFKEYMTRATVKEEYMGLLLINSLTIGQHAESHAYALLKVGVLPAFSTSFTEDRLPSWDTILLWKRLVDGFLRTVKEGDALRISLLQEKLALDKCVAGATARWNSWDISWTLSHQRIQPELPSLAD